MRFTHPIRAAFVRWLIDPLTTATIWLGECAYSGVIALRRWAYEGDDPF